MEKHSILEGWGALSAGHICQVSQPLPSHPPTTIESKLSTTLVSTVSGALSNRCSGFHLRHLIPLYFALSCSVTLSDATNPHSNSLLSLWGFETPSRSLQHRHPRSPSHIVISDLVEHVLNAVFTISGGRYISSKIMRRQKSSICLENLDNVNGKLNSTLWRSTTRTNKYVTNSIAYWF